MNAPVRIACFSIVAGCVAAASAADGLESLGNTDGVLTWQIGTLASGDSARRVVLFAFDPSPKDLAKHLEQARRKFAQATQPAEPAGQGTASEIVWIKNATTDFAVSGPGHFFWEGARQSLTCPQGGQLSRFGYYVHYDDGQAKRAGTPITGGNAENLQVVQPIRPVGTSEAVGLMRTGDGAIGIRIRPMMGDGPVAAVEFLLTNLSEKPLLDVRLSVSSNLESAHTHQNDYSTLDRLTGGLLVFDPATKMCAVMAGLSTPALGYSGTWPSQKQLAEGTGITADKWNEFTGSGEDVKKLLAKLPKPNVPHSIAAPGGGPVTPETRDLTPAEARDALHRDWLFQADGKPTVARALQEIGWARELAARQTRHPQPPDLSAELARLTELEKRLTAPEANTADATAVQTLYLAVRSAKREIAFKNPAINFSSVLLIDNPYPQGAEWPHQARHRNGMMAVPGGRLLVLDGLHPGGHVRQLAPESPGSFWRPDVSFDGRRALFCYKAHDDLSFHLYEINIDGSGLRQLTTGDYDDIDPIYLPDGHIVFSSTRANTYVRCMPYTYSYVLARCDADGENVYIVSRNNEPDWCPALLNDGRVCYSRWEYHDKALWRIQSLWSMNQDGTGVATFWGNQSVWPDHLAEPRPIPGSTRVMFTGVAHHNWFAGSIGILDTSQGRNFPLGLTKVTCDTPWPECGTPPVDPHEADDYHASGRFAAYKSPYPISPEDFLVSANRGGKFNLYLMDVHGNRELIYEAVHNAWHAMPAARRPMPQAQPNRVVWPGTGDRRKPVEPGVIYSANVYQGVPDLPQGIVKHLRVVQMDARTYSTWTRDGRFSGPVVSAIQDDGVKRILGTTPVLADGSFSVKVPPGRALHFQLLDEHYRALHTMRSFTGVMPGERRGCVGCHELHGNSPVSRPSLAVRRPPVELTPPPWGTESISYEQLVQPVLDRYCGKCHQGDGEARKDFDLTLRPGAGPFKEPYLSLVGYANYFRGVSNAKDEGIAGALKAENFAQSDPHSYTTFRPMKHLSYKSRLIEMASSGKHYDVELDA
ncbi:MAG: PD40 domain-containing protein, partial [Planctomycetes bacterium]|nr:PD40 domain-containing protein [Planctomycetota bacterium]